MKTFLKIFALLLLITNILSAKAPSPVKFVDVKKFSGLWYEIARTYNDFEKDCVAATVEYILVDDYEYEIKNRCFNKKIGADLIEYTGVGEPTKGKSMSRIDMTYFWFFTSTYRVVYLLEDYSSAVVVDKDMEQVWIMNRKPFMPKQRLDEILKLLEPYMDLKRLIYTPQDEKGRYK